VKGHFYKINIYTIIHLAQSIDNDWLISETIPWLFLHSQPGIWGGHWEYLLLHSRFYGHIFTF